MNARKQTNPAGAAKRPQDELNSKRELVDAELPGEALYQV
jgi:hypothetical protein